MLEQYVKKILTSYVYDVTVETPLQPARQLFERLGNQALLRREDLQPVSSFKIRGAYDKAVQFIEEEKVRGVTAASADNHAQGLALAAKWQGIRAVIVMPKTTLEIRVQVVRIHGARVVLHDDAFPEALTHVLKLVDEKGYTFVHSYDDPDTIVGQGTVAMGILHQQPGRPGVIFVPVGGGGLVAGIAAYVKCLRLETKVIGVELDEPNCLQAAMVAGERVVLGQVGLFADGVAVVQIGQYTFDACKNHVDETITVSTDEICAAIRDIYDDTRSITGPVGALAVAGIKKCVECERVEGQTLVVVDSGANVNFDCLWHVIERAGPDERRGAIIAATIPERLDSSKAFCEAVGKRQVTELNYRYYSGNETRILVGMQIHLENGPREALVVYLCEKGFPVLDLTDNELAKLYIRHVVGGHAVEVSDKVVFCFGFPERPGALFNFLTKPSGRWNILMLHYRNHDAADDRVMAGSQVPEDERHLIPQILEVIGYPYWDETANPVYQPFLG